VLELPRLPFPSLHLHRTAHGWCSPQIMAEDLNEALIQEDEEEGEEEMTEEDEDEMQSDDEVSDEEELSSASYDDDDDDDYLVEFWKRGDTSDEETEEDTDEKGEVVNLPSFESVCWRRLPLSEIRAFVDQKHRRDPDFLLRPLSWKREIPLHIAIKYRLPLEVIRYLVHLNPKAVTRTTRA
jgi:hypothetical protein